MVSWWSKSSMPSLPSPGNTTRNCFSEAYRSLLQMTCLASEPQGLFINSTTKHSDHWQVMSAESSDWRGKAACSIVWACQWAPFCSRPHFKLAIFWVTSLIGQTSTSGEGFALSRTQRGWTSIGLPSLWQDLQDAAICSLCWECPGTFLVTRPLKIWLKW